MALASTVSGDGILVNQSTVVHEFTIIPATGGTVTITETRTSETRQWVAVTAAAAKTWVETAPTPGEGETKSRSISESNRVLGAYTCEEITETVTVDRDYTPPES